MSVEGALVRDGWIVHLLVDGCWSPGSDEEPPLGTMAYRRRKGVYDCVVSITYERVYKVVRALQVYVRERGC